MNLADLAAFRGAPLLHVYPGQATPQPAYVQLDPESGALSADWAGESSGTVPMRVWNRTLLWMRVCPYLRGDVLAGALDTDEARALVAKIRAGYFVLTSDGREKGGLNDQAQDALDRLRLLLERLEEEPGALLEVEEAD